MRLCLFRKNEIKGIFYLSSLDFVDLVAVRPAVGLADSRGRCSAQESDTSPQIKKKDHSKKKRKIIVDLELTH